jgi:hypothetical protein
VKGGGPDKTIIRRKDGTFASVDHANHQLHILDVRSSQSQTVGNDALQWAGFRHG